MTDLTSTLSDAIALAAREAVQEGMDAILERIDAAIADDPRQLVTIETMASECPISEGALRKLVWRRERNGLLAAGAVVELGRRKYINRRKFYKWFEETRGGAT